MSFIETQMKGTSDMTSALVDFKPRVSRAASVARPVRSGRALCLISQTTIAGTRHVPGIQEAAQSFERGCRLVFERDADNAYDPWAVRVLDSSRNRLGYVSCDCNEVVARLMDGGKRVFGLFEGVQQIDAWTRIEMGVYLDD